MRAALRDRPVATALELSTLLASAGLLVAVVVSLGQGPPPRGSSGLRLAIVVVGVAVTTLWTVVLPTYDRIVTDGCGRSE